MQRRRKRLNTFAKVCALAAVSTMIVSSAMAQTSTTSTTMGQQKKPSLMSRLFKHKPTTTTPMHGSRSMQSSSMNRMKGGSFGSGLMHSGIIGNKTSKVYHMAGDKNLPAPQNRMYFHSVAEAQRAGYRAAGRPGRPSAKRTMMPSGATMRTH